MDSLDNIERKRIIDMLNENDKKLEKIFPKIVIQKDNDGNEIHLNEPVFTNPFLLKMNDKEFYNYLRNNKNE